MFEDGADYIPYLAVKNDSAATGRAVWISLMSGEFGEISPFTVTPDMLAAAREVKKQEINARRDRQENRSVILDLMGMRGTAAKHPSPVYLLLLRQRRQACCHPDFSGRMQTTTMLS